MLARGHQGSVAEECRLFDARLLINVGLLALPRRSCSLFEFHQVPRMLRKLNVPNECWLDTIFDREFARATRAHARTRARVRLDSDVMGACVGTASLNFIASYPILDQSRERLREKRRVKERDWRIFDGIHDHDYDYFDVMQEPRRRTLVPD